MSGLFLAYRPNHLATASITLTYSFFRIGADYRYVSRLSDVKVYPRDERVAQKIIDLRMGFVLGRFKLAVDVDNFLNYNYTQVERTLMPIRHYTLTLTTDF